MMFLFLLLVLAATAALVWFQGLWSGAISLVNLLLAMVVASSLYEPLVSALENIGPLATYTYLLDFVMLWLIFAFTYTILRAVTDYLSPRQIKFPMPVEMAGRTIFALWCGWLMVCFVAFSLHMAPLNSVNPLGAFQTPSAKTMGPVSPDRMWIGFLYSRSRGALGGNVFDEEANFPLRYHERRVKYSAEGASLRFPRQ